MYYDIHTHMIPGIDDGSPSESVSLRMLQMSYADGVDHIILTSHYNERYGWTENVLKHFEQMQSLAEKISPDMKVYPGNEIYYSSNTISLLKRGDIQTLAGSRYVLIEFSYHIPYQDIKRAVQDLQQAGYWPIIAHCERYHTLYKEKGRAEDLTEIGAYLQVNAETFISGGFKQKRFADKLMKNDYISFVASDCHDLGSRKPNISECIPVLIKKYGKELMGRVLTQNPQLIIRNKWIDNK